MIVEDMAKKLVTEIFFGCTVDHAENVAALLIHEAIAAEREECANVAFEKIRCDDRTNRLLIANEVAAHIRARK